MRRWVFVISIILLVAWVTAPAIFTAASEKELRAISGEISAIDAKAMTMSVKEEVAGSGVEEIQFVIDPGATLRMHGQKGRNFSQLKVGDYVTVRYATKDGRNVAMEVQHS